MGQVGDGQVLTKQPTGVVSSHTAYHGGESETTNDTIESSAGFLEIEKIEKLEIVQRIDPCEVCLGWNRPSRYCINDENREQIFYVYEASVCFNRQVTGSLRELALKVSVSGGEQEEVLTLHRPAACSSRCCWACCRLQQMHIALPGGRTVASVNEVWSFCTPEYKVEDSNNQLLYNVRGGLCHCRCCCQLDFRICNSGGEEVGTIQRSCQGCKELIGAANKYTVEFNKCLPPQEKLIVLGTSFLIDLNYFEKQNKCW